MDIPHPKMWSIHQFPTYIKAYNQPSNIRNYNVIVVLRKSDSDKLYLLILKYNLKYQINLSLINRFWVRMDNHIPTCKSDMVLTKIKKC